MLRVQCGISSTSRSVVAISIRCSSQPSMAAASNVPFIAISSLVHLRFQVANTCTGVNLLVQVYTGFLPFIVKMQK